MRISFEKYHGTGNDFIMIDIRNHAIQEDPDRIAQICHRKYGIGADGLILLGNSVNYDFLMRYFNADGNEASMCGNGGRCITSFARQLGIIDKKTVFEAVDGIHKASILSQSGDTFEVKLQMADVQGGKWEGEGIFLDTGSPHYVQICDDLEQLDVQLEGNRLRNDPRFGPDGTNVNFIEEKDGKLHIRTYERGVEAETNSCGTGVTAAALAWALRQQLSSPIRLMSTGGPLMVYFSRDGGQFTDIFLEGPAVHVYSGKIEI